MSLNIFSSVSLKYFLIPDTNSCVRCGNTCIECPHTSVQRRLVYSMTIEGDLNVHI